MLKVSGNTILIENEEFQSKEDFKNLKKDIISEINSMTRKEITIAFVNCKFKGYSGNLQEEITQQASSMRKKITFMFVNCNNENCIINSFNNSSFHLFDKEETYRKSTKCGATSNNENCIINSFNKNSCIDSFKNICFRFLDEKGEETCRRFTKCESNSNNKNSCINSFNDTYIGSTKLGPISSFLKTAATVVLTPVAVAIVAIPTALVAIPSLIHSKVKSAIKKRKEKTEPAKTENQDEIDTKEC